MRRTCAIFISLATSACLVAGTAAAQDASSQDTDTIETVQPKKKRIVRIVEAIPMWVESEQLRIRDNPYAGDVIGMLEMGQKIKIHERADNWIRISANGKPAKWVNSDFLSKSRVTWSNYQFGSQNRTRANAPYDVDLKRIKIKDLKDMKIYAAHIKADSNNGRVVITRHDFRSGPYYEKRIVHCDSAGNASHVRMIGEGYNYQMMERDPRGAAISEPIHSDFAIDAEGTSALNQGIAEFTCEAKNI